MSPESTSSSQSDGAAASSAVVNSAELSTGTMVGEYRVDGQLGSGPTGRVFSAVHAVTSRRTAIKVLEPEVASTREPVEKYFAEARAANQLGHPNIVDMLAFGKLADGRNYVVMELLRGESLREGTKRARMPIAEGLAIISTATLALTDAHDKGIIHRNLKPENIFLVEVKGERPQVKLLDFGTAELLGPRAEGRKGSALAYLSPEQALGDSLDASTDVYALGAIAFELVTGSPHSREKPRAASSVNSEVPAALDALIASMLATKPGERPSLEKIRSELRGAALLAGARPTRPAGVPVVQAGDAAAAKKDAKTDAKVEAKKNAKAETKTDAKKDAAAVATATDPAPSNAPTSKGGGIVAIVLLVAAAIGIGIWIYLNQSNGPVETAPAPAVAPPAAPEGSAAAAGSAEPAAPPAAAPEGSTAEPAGSAGPAAAPAGSAAPTGSAAAAPTATADPVQPAAAETPAAAPTPEAVPTAGSDATGSADKHHGREKRQSTPATPAADPAAPTP